MKNSDNYLDYVFCQAESLDWDEVWAESEDEDAEETVAEITGAQDPSDSGRAAPDDAREPLVVLHIRHQGLSHRIAEKFFDRPAVTHVHLEPMGSFIWRRIDGNRSVYEIGQCLHEAFGETAEPLFERLSVYMKQLERNGLITRRK